jgi:molybdopterin molybdotransferase
MPLRVFRGWDDLEAMQRVVAEGLRDAPDRGYVHPGDVAWWVGWHPRSPAPDELIGLWEPDERIEGWAMIDTGRVEAFLAPDLLETDAPRTFFSEVDAWALERSLPNVRHVYDGDRWTAAILTSEGFDAGDIELWCYERDLADLPGVEGDVRPVQTHEDVEDRASITFAAFGDPPSFAGYLAEYRVFVASPAYPLGWDLVCRTPEGSPASCCIAWPDPVSRTGNFEPVSTHPEHQRRGYGRTVMADGLRRLSAAGMDRVIVRTNVGNEAADALYRSLGFRRRNVVRSFARPDPRRIARLRPMTGREVHDHDSGEGLVPIDEARRKVLSAIEPLPPLQMPLTDAYGCVAAEDMVAKVDLPEFASSAMDGFAVRAYDVIDATPSSPAELKVVGRSEMGKRPEATVGMGEAVKIATGAPLPAGADAIVPIENAEEDEGLVRLFEAAVEGKHVRPRGEDVHEGDLLVPRGRRLAGAELGLLANAGVPHPLVHPRPRVIVLSTGDELIPPTETPQFGQVRDANAYTLFGALREVGAIPVLAGIVKDDPDALKETVFSFEIQADAFVSSGGISVGERDVVKAAFFRRGDIEFSKVAMQPGMPQGFGFIEGKPFFGLPGNPVSTFVSFELFVRPAMLKMMGRTQLGRPEVTATLTGEIRGPKDKVVFARVEVARGPEGWAATPTGGRGSNLIATVARANGLAIVPSGVEVKGPGDQVRVLLFRASED